MKMFICASLWCRLTSRFHPILVVAFRLVPLGPVLVHAQFVLLFFDLRTAFAFVLAAALAFDLARPLVFPLATATNM